MEKITKTTGYKFSVEEVTDLANDLAGVNVELSEVSESLMKELDIQPVVVETEVEEESTQEEASNF